MPTIQDFLNAINYRISQGDKFGWECFGPNTYSLDSWQGNIDDSSFSMTFDTMTQKVYQISMCDYANKVAYQWTDPGYIDAYMNRVSGLSDPRNIAWDKVEYTNTELAEDILVKITAASNGKEYDRRVSVPLEMDEKEMFRLMKMAHERDITLNQLVEEVLKNKIDELSKKED